VRTALSLARCLAARSARVGQPFLRDHFCPLENDAAGVIPFMA